MTARNGDLTRIYALVEGPPDFLSEVPTGDLVQTDDLVVEWPLFHNAIIREEVDKGLQEGRGFYDADGNRLFTVNDVMMALRRDGKVLAKPGKADENEPA